MKKPRPPVVSDDSGASDGIGSNVMAAKSKTKSHRKKPNPKKSSAGSAGDAKLKALLFDFGGTLAFLDYKLLARASSAGPDASSTRSGSSSRNIAAAR